MSSFADELRLKKLKKTEPPKRPDLAQTQQNAFLTHNEIKAYQENVLDCNVEMWYDLIKDCTFETKFCPIFKEEAKFFIDVYDQFFRDKNFDQIEAIEWRKLLTQEQESVYRGLETRLNDNLTSFLNETEYAFVKTSSRSAKDSPLASRQFKLLYENYIKELNIEKPSENEQIICLLKAAFECLRVKQSEQVIEMFIKSERIYQDMTLALENPNRFNENFVIRKFYDIDVDMEFRGFVFDWNLNALSQYNYLIYSKRLDENKDAIQHKISNYYSNEVLPKLKDSKQFLSNFVIDFAILPDERVIVIELNPFLQTTDGALFSWTNEKHILEGSNGFLFRYTTKPQPGAKTMLPFSIRQIMDTKIVQ